MRKMLKPGSAILLLVGTLPALLFASEMNKEFPLRVHIVRIERQPAGFALLVDAKDDTAAGFYRKHGFAALASRPLTLFLPIATALKLFS